jgi:ABC-type phosphate transport system auxiliary subunit
MGKTLEQKLQGAKEEIRNSKKKIKEQERKLHAYQHQVDSLRTERQKLQAEARISEAKLKSADMFICYLQSLVSENDEVRMPLDKLYAFANKNIVEWKMDDINKEIVIRTHKKEL